MPTKIEKNADGKLVVSFELNGAEQTELYDTVLFATGRAACTTTIGIEHAGVHVDARFAADGQ